MQRIYITDLMELEEISILCKFEYVFLRIIIGLLQVDSMYIH